MNIKTHSQVLDEISQEAIPPDLNLLPGVLEKIQLGNQLKMKTARKLRFAVLLLALILLASFFMLPGVASALKRMIGYIPGVGVVEQSAPLRVLEHPVTDTRIGFTITVESALLDSTRTVLIYTITGQFPTWDEPSLKPRMCQEYPILRLSGGKKLAYPSRVGSSGGGKSQWKDVYPAIPAAENRATLVLPCLSELPVNEGPQNWEIPLAFVPAPPEMTFYPVLEVTTPLVEQPTSAIDHPNPLAEEPTPAVDRPRSTLEQPATAVELPTPLTHNTEEAFSADWMQLTLQGAAALENGYYLQAVLNWQKDPAIFDVQIYPDSIHLFDAEGQEVPAWPADQTPPFASAADQSMALNLQTASILAPGPVRLVVDYVVVGMLASNSFSFDTGDNPQPGQTWELNQDLEVNGYHLRVLSAEYMQTPPGEPVMLMIYLASDSGILTVNALDSEHAILDTGGSPGSANVPFRAGWHYKDGFPQGRITVEITVIAVRRSGPWSVEWTPPAAPSASTATP